MHEYDEVLRVFEEISSTTRTPKIVMAIPYNLKKALDSEMYIEVTKGGNATLVVLSGKFGNTIFTGKRGQIEWVGNTGRFTEGESGNIVYMDAYSADKEEVLKLKKIALRMFQPTIKLETQLPKVPEKLVIYKTKEPKVTKEDFLRIAEKFSLKGSLVETNNRFILKNESMELEIMKASGRMTYGDISEMYGDLTKTPNLPDEKMAVDIAYNWLKNFGLAPEDAKFSKVVRDWVEVARKDGVRRVDIITQVIFKREIGRFPVEG
ncbi:hypothetical protein DRP07_07440, partial [Archaeoglobales archaeon]